MFVFNRVGFNPSARSSSPEASYDDTKYQENSFPRSPFLAGGTLAATMFHPEPASGANELWGDTLVVRNDDKLKPVDNMHHFMEYIYEPVFNRLKGAMEKAPTDKAGWTQLKSDSLILAETSILLVQRVPEKKDSKTWVDSSAVTYQGASALYQSARKKEFEGVKKGFAQMIEGCAKCHEAYRE